MQRDASVSKKGRITLNSHFKAMFCLFSHLLHMRVLMEMLMLKFVAVVE